MSKKHFIGKRQIFRRANANALKFLRQKNDSIVNVDIDENNFQFQCSPNSSPEIYIDNEELVASEGASQDCSGISLQNDELHNTRFFDKNISENYDSNHSDNLNPLVPNGTYEYHLFKKLIKMYLTRNIGVLPGGTPESR